MPSMRDSCESFFLQNARQPVSKELIPRCVHLDMASNFAGTLLGITNCAANMMGVVAPAVAGYLTQVSPFQGDLTIRLCISRLFIFLPFPGPQ